MKRIVTRILVALVMALGVFFTLSPSVFAVDVLPNSDGVCSKSTATGDAPDICKDNLASKGNDSNPVLGKNGFLTIGIKIFTFVLGVVAVFVLMINGVRMMTASGDPNSINTARNGVIYALIGLVIAFSAQMLVTFVLNKL